MSYVCRLLSIRKNVICCSSLQWKGVSILITSLCKCILILPPNTDLCFIFYWYFIYIFKHFTYAKNCIFYEMSTKIWNFSFEVKFSLQNAIVPKTRAFIVSKILIVTSHCLQVCCPLKLNNNSWIFWLYLYLYWLYLKTTMNFDYRINNGFYLPSYWMELYYLQNNKRSVAWMRCQLRRNPCTWL